MRVTFLKSWLPKETSTSWWISAWRCGHWWCECSDSSAPSWIARMTGNSSAIPRLIPQDVRIQPFSHLTQLMWAFALLQAQCVTFCMTQEKPLHSLSILLFVRAAASHKWSLSKRWRCGTEGQQEEMLHTNLQLQEHTCATLHSYRQWDELVCSPLGSKQKEKTQKSTDFKTRPHLQELITRLR